MYKFYNANVHGNFVYDIFDCRNRAMWTAWKVDKICKRHLGE